MLLKRKKDLTNQNKSLNSIRRRIVTEYSSKEITPNKTRNKVRKENARLLNSKRELELKSYFHDPQNLGRYKKKHRLGKNLRRVSQTKTLSNKIKMNSTNDVRRAAPLRNRKFLLTTTNVDQLPLVAKTDFLQTSRHTLQKMSSQVGSTILFNKKQQSSLFESIDGLSYANHKSKEKMINKAKDEKAARSRNLNFENLNQRRSKREKIKGIRSLNFKLSKKILDQPFAQTSRNNLSLTRSYKISKPNLSGSQTTRCKLLNIKKLN